MAKLVKIEEVEEIAYTSEKEELNINGVVTKPSSVGKVKTKGGLRDAFIVPEDCYWVTADYSAQEMVCAANFSGEPHLIEPLLEGKDIHNYVAKQMFGYEDPSHRTKVKILNFACMYGANEFTIARKLQVPVPEAKTLLDKYYKTLSKLTAWKEEMQKNARRKGMVFTYFGRPRLLYKYYNTSDSQMKAFADRTAVNSPIQGCFPTQAYLETANGVVSTESVLGQRLSAYDGNYIIPSHRGENEPLLLIMKSGDYIVCDVNHSLIKGTIEQPQIASLRDGLKGKVLLSPLHPKSKPDFRQLLKSSADCASYLKLRCNAIKIDKGDKIIAACFLKLALTRYKFKYNYNVLLRLRSLGSVYGYNVILKNGKMTIRFKRKSKTSLARLYTPLEENQKVSVGSCTAVSGFQMYQNQGFYNKNTGGDLIRIDLCKFYELIENDEEFRENVKLVNSVHDEVNFYVKKNYLYKACNKIQEVMNYHPKNFKVPLLVTVGVGRSWGTCLDAKVTENNKLIL